MSEILKDIQEWRNVYNEIFPKGESLLFLMYNLHPTGITKSLFSLLRNLINEGYEVKLLVCVRGEKDLPSPIVPIYLYNSENEMWKMIGSNTIVIPFEQVYDRVVAYDGILSTWLATYLKYVNKKIAWLHAPYKISHVGFEAGYVREVYRHMDHLVAVSYDVKQTYLDALQIEEAHIKVIYTKLDSQIIREQSRKELFIKEGLVAVSVGRLVTEKGFERLMSVHKKLVDEGIQHELWIVGDGELKQELKNRIHDLGISQTCKLLGYHDNPYPIMNRADVIVSASFSEGLPLAMMEAMILHKPIVATNILGNREVLKANMGMLVEDNEEGLYEGMKLMLRQESLRKAYEMKLESSVPFLFEVGR